MQSFTIAIDTTNGYHVPAGATRCAAALIRFLENARNFNGKITLTPADGREPVTSKIAEGYKISGTRVQRKAHESYIISQANTDEYYVGLQKPYLDAGKRCTESKPCSFCAHLDASHAPNLAVLAAEDMLDALALRLIVKRAKLIENYRANRTARFGEVRYSDGWRTVTATVVKFNPIKAELAEALALAAKTLEIGQTITINGKTYTLDFKSLFDSKSIYFKVGRSIVRISDHWSDAKVEGKGPHITRCDLVKDQWWELAGTAKEFRNAEVCSWPMAGGIAQLTDLNMAADHWIK